MGISKSGVKSLSEQYLDEVVVIHLSDIKVITADENGNALEISAMIEGMVNDIDQDFIHLTSIEGFPKSVPHDKVGLIELAIMADDISTMMPEFGEEVH